MKSLIKENILNIIVSLIILSIILVFYTTNVILSEAKDLKTKRLPLLGSSAFLPKNTTEIEGRIVTITGDNFDYKTGKIKSSYTKTYLQTKNKKLIELKPANFATAPNINSIEPNTVVKVKGIKTKDRIIYYRITPIKQNKSIKLKNYKKNNKLNYLQQDETPDTIGEQKTLVALFNYADDQSRPITLDYVKREIMYKTQSVDNFVKENSYKKAWLNSTFIDWQMLPSSSIEYKNKSYKALDAAIKTLDDEVYFPSYERLIFIFLDGGKIINAAGLATIGKDNLESSDGNFDASVSWIVGTYSVASSGIFAHELGHNFGFVHASSFEAVGDSKIPPDLLDFAPGTSQGNTYSYDEYGDEGDIMGWGYKHWSTIWKKQAGWLEPSQVKVVTRSAEYILDQVELASSGIKALMIPLGKDINGPYKLGNILWRKHDNEAYYFLEYRKGIGLFDDNDEIQVRLKNMYYAPEVNGWFWFGNLKWSGNPVRFIKNHFNSNTYSPDYKDINADESFYDPYRGIKIELLEKTGEGADSKARLRVTFSQVKFSSPYLLRSIEWEEECGNPQLMTIANETQIPLDVGQISVAGRDASSFEIFQDNASNKTIPIGGVATFKVHFSPKTNSQKFAYLNIPTNDDIRPNATISLIGIDDMPPWQTTVSAPFISSNVSTTTSFNISWSDIDNFSTIAGFQLRYRTHITSAWHSFTVDNQEWMPKTSVKFTGKLGYTYYFSVRAKDQAGNIPYWWSNEDWIPDNDVTIVPYDDQSLRYSSNWKNATSSSAFKKTLKYSNTKSSYATMTIKYSDSEQQWGSKLALIAPKGPNRGLVYVYVRDKVNGVWTSYTKIKTIDLYSSTYKSRVTIALNPRVYDYTRYEWIWDDTLTHQIKFVVAGKKRAASTSTRVYIDGLAIGR